MQPNSTGAVHKVRSTVFSSGSVQSYKKYTFPSPDFFVMS